METNSASEKVKKEGNVEIVFKNCVYTQYWCTFIGLGKPQAFGMAPKTSNDAIAGNGMHDIWNVYID